jgi:hypothetical protein
VFHAKASATKPQKRAPGLTLKSQVPRRFFPTEVDLGGLEVVVCPKFPLSSNVQLPTASMTLLDLVGWLTGRINDINGEEVTEESALLWNISEWAARIHGNLDAGETQRRMFLVSLIGKQVKLNSGTYMRLIGMREGEFMIQDMEGNGDIKVVQMEGIAGEHVDLEGL